MGWRGRYLRDGQVLIPGTYEYGILHDRRDFADVIKTGPCDGEILQDSPGGPDVVITPLKSEKLSSMWSEGDVTTK